MSQSSEEQPEQPEQPERPEGPERPERRPRFGERTSSPRGGYRRDGRGGEKRDQTRDRGTARRGGDARRDSPAQGGRDFRGRSDERGGPRGGYRREGKGWDRREDRSRTRDRGERERLKRLPIPEDVTGEEIDQSVRQELQSMPKTLALDVAKNLVMVARLIDEEPDRAYGHSRIALRLASRVGAVREAAGFAAYAVQKYGEALAEFRAARRMTGSVHLWPIMADCERGLGRPERALAMAKEPDVRALDKAGQMEMRLVAAGARRDMGQAEAAVVTLQIPELASRTSQPWTARLRYAYADALLAVGREEEAREWFGRALEADQDGTTDASDRLAELDGLEFIDAMDPAADEPGDPAEPVG